MDSLKKQRIESSSITCVSKKVDRFSFDGGMAPRELISQTVSLTLEMTKRVPSLMKTELDFGSSTLS